MKAKVYQRNLWKSIDLHQLNKHLKTHNVSTKTIENELVVNEKQLKKRRSIRNGLKKS